MKKTILLGITSGIAAFKALDLVKELKKEQIDVHVIMTEKSRYIVSPEALEKASGNQVHTQLFKENFDYKEILNKRKVDHIELADGADAMVIAPATANTLAKIAHGFADDFLTTTILAMTKPVIICPSMNVNMWNNPIVKGNIEKLKKQGYVIIRPTSGMLACGYEGEGKLEDIVKIKAETLRQLNRSTQLKGQRFIVTAGGTREVIDGVRFITNKSSGKMGAAIAEELFLRGAEVLLIRAKDAIKPRYVIKEEQFETSAQLHDLVKQYVNAYDTIFHAAAVSDFQVADPQTGKISSTTDFTLKMKPQIKIVDQIKTWNPKVRLIAFKAIAGQNEKEMIEIAKKKIQTSRADAVVANDISAFENDTNEVIVVRANGSLQKIIRGSKKRVSQELMNYLL